MKDPAMPKRQRGHRVLFEFLHKFCFVNFECSVFVGRKSRSLQLLQLLNEKKKRLLLKKKTMASFLRAIDGRRFGGLSKI